MQELCIYRNIASSTFQQLKLPFCWLAQVQGHVLNLQCKIFVSKHWKIFECYETQNKANTNIKRWTALICTCLIRKNNPNFILHTLGNSPICTNIAQTRNQVNMGIGTNLIPNIPSMWLRVCLIVHVFRGSSQTLLWVGIEIILFFWLVRDYKPLGLATHAIGMGFLHCWREFIPVQHSIIVLIYQFD